MSISDLCDVVVFDVVGCGSVENTVSLSDLPEVVVFEVVVCGGESEPVPLSDLPEDENSDEGEEIMDCNTVEDIDSINVEFSR